MTEDTARAIELTPNQKLVNASYDHDTKELYILTRDMKKHEEADTYRFSTYNDDGRSYTFDEETIIIESRDRSDE